MAIKRHPCADGLTPECFEDYPEWAKRAFAYRLLCMIAPPAITKRLQRVLKRAMFFPGVTIPPGVELPPGVIVPPDTTFPPGWQPGDPLPPGAIPPAIDWDNPPAPAITPPENVAPFGPGPTHPPGSSPPGEVTIEIYSSTGDGHVYISRTSWSAAHDALTGSSFNTTDTIDSDGICASKTGITYPIRRCFFYFDLSSIPASKTVLSVDLFIRGFGYAESNVSVQEGTQSDPLAVEDFDAFTGAYFRQILWTSSDNNFAFDAAGVAFIQSKLGATAKLCLREYYHDYLDITPTVLERCGLYFSNHSTVSRRPKLIIVYS